MRLEARRSEETRLLFCTTGILLRRLHSDPCLAATTHLVVDEVHERSLDTDLLLALLRELPGRRAEAGHPPLKLLLMSATVDSALLSAYFGDCPVLSAPGRAFPVTYLHLEDVYQATGYLLAPDSPERAQAAAGTSALVSVDGTAGVCVCLCVCVCVGLYVFACVLYVCVLSARLCLCV